MNNQPLVLVADDEPRITKLVAVTLSDEGFRVITASGGEEALQKADEMRPDIVLLDIVMPDLDGIEVMRQLREFRPVPVILLTAKGATADKAKGLDLGADDYIAKPFHPDELAARVRAVLRRAAGVTPGGGIVRIGDVEIDLERRMMTRDGELVQLSRTEWLLLQHLAANAGKVVLHSELLTKVWGPEYRDDLQYLRVWVSRVRRKLGAQPGEPGPITTFQGIGYVLNVDEEPRSRGPVERVPCEGPMVATEVGESCRMSSLPIGRWASSSLSTSSFSPNGDGPRAVETSGKRARAPGLGGATDHPGRSRRWLADSSRRPTPTARPGRARSSATRRSRSSCSILRRPNGTATTPMPSNGGARSRRPIRRVG